MKKHQNTCDAAFLIARLVILLALVQLLRLGLQYLVTLAFGSGALDRKMTTMAAMLILTVAFALFSHVRRVPLSLFPARFGKGYVAATAVAAVLLITTPSNYTGGLTAILALFYGSVVTPVFEGLIFRGYVWNRLGEALPERGVFVADTALFTLWHLGFVMTNLIAGDMAAVVGKLAAGLCYGVVLGLIRLKTKNCYSTMLVHGVLNIFMV